MKKLWNKFCKIIDKIIKVYEWVEINFIIWFTILVGALIMVEIILRLFQIQGSKWIEEIARYMLVTTTFLGSSIAVSQKGHATMSALINALPCAWSNILEIITNLIGGVGFLFLSYAAFEWTGKLIKTGKLMESISIPMWYLWAVISVAFLTTGIRYMAQIVKNVQALRTGTYEATPDKEM